MKKILILLLLIPLFSIGQVTYLSATAGSCKIDSDGNKKFEQDIDAFTTIEIDLPFIRINLFQQNKYEFYVMETKVEDIETVNYIFASESGISFLTITKQTIFLSFFREDDSGDIFIFKNCQIL